MPYPNTKNPRIIEIFHMKLLFLLFNFRKTSAEGKNKSFKIKQNQNGNGISIDYAIVFGTCCWNMCDRFGNCDEFGPGQDGEPPRYIYSILAADC